QFWGTYWLIATIFTWLTLALLAYLAAAFYARPDAGAVLQGTFLPRIQLNRDYLETFVAILGTTISPYLFFWQASQEVEENKQRFKKPRQEQGSRSETLTDTAWDI